MNITPRVSRNLGPNVELGELITSLTTSHSLISRGAWGHGPNIQMYLRVAPIRLSQAAILHAQSGRALQIANVEVNTEYRRQGVFTRWFLEIEEAVSRSPLIDFVYVENVMNPHLAEFLDRRGYDRVKMWDRIGNNPEVYSHFKRMEAADAKSEDA